MWKLKNKITNKTNRPGCREQPMVARGRGLEGGEEGRAEK